MHSPRQRSLAKPWQPRTVHTVKLTVCQYSFSPRIWCLSIFFCCACRACAPVDSHQWLPLPWPPPSLRTSGFRRSRCPHAGSGVYPGVTCGAPGQPMLFTLCLWQGTSKGCLGNPRQPYLRRERGSMSRRSMSRRTRRPRHGHRTRQTQPTGVVVASAVADTATQTRPRGLSGHVGALETWHRRRRRAPGRPGDPPHGPRTGHRLPQLPASTLSCAASR